MTSEARLARGPLLAHAGIVLLTTILLATDVLPVLFTGDVNRYHAIASGPRFWTSQPVEFPPGSAALVWLVGRWGAASIKVLLLTNLVLDGATVALLLRTGHARVANRYLALSAPLLPITLFRLDHLGVLVAAAGLVALHRGREDRAGVLLGLGVLTKLWPAVLLVATPRRDVRTLVAAIGTVAVGSAAWLLLFGVDAASQVLSFRNAVGWHVESMPGSLLRLVAPGEAVMDAGAWRVGSPPGVATAALAVLGAGILLLAWRMPAVDRRHVGLVAGLLLVSPLFSPQFLLWLVVPVAFLRLGVVGRVAATATAGAGVLTLALATFYLDVLLGTAVGMVLVGVRNLLVAVVCVVTLLPLLDRSRDAVPDTLSAV